MSKLRRFVSSMATAAILVSGISVTSLASIPTDVIGTDYETAAKVLGAFEIMVGNGTSFRPDAPITRAEVTKVAVALKGLSKAATSQTKTKFTDVKEGHWATGYINLGVSEKLIFGDGNGKFRPDDSITYNEAVTILVRALGYEPHAQSKGGYPRGYLSAGNSTGLTSGIPTTVARSSAPITRGKVALLACNALDINTMEQVSFGGSEKFEITDETLAKSAHNADKVEGMVSAIGSSAIKGSGVSRGEIVINGKNYKTGNADVRNILGLNVGAYIVNDSKNKNTLKVAVPSDDMNSVITISGENIDSIKKSGDTKTITYYDTRDKKSTVSISDDSYVIYNGKAGSFDDIKMIDQGTIMVAEYDKNQKIVFVNETENFVVDEVFLSSGRVTDKYGKTALILDEKNDDIVFSINKNGSSVALDKLNEWDVLSLTVSKDKSVIHADVCSDNVKGKITATDDEHVYIGKDKYKVAKNYTAEIKLGDEGIFYLDAEGKIAAVQKEKNVSKNYAYITNLGIKSGLDAKLEIEILNLEGKVTTHTAANKIKVDGKNYSSHKDAMSAIGSKGQLAIVELNSDGKISNIEKSVKDSEIDESAFKLNFAEDDVKFNAKTSTLLADTMNVRVDKDTIVFDINAKSDKTEDYGVAGMEFFADEGKYDIMVYDVTEDFTAKVVIVTNSEDKVTEDSSIVVVDKLATAKDEDGEIKEQLYGFYNGEKVTFVAEKGIFKKGSLALENGDIIQVKADAKNNVKAISVLFDTDKDSEFTKDISENLTTLYGKVTKKFANSFNLSVNDGTSKNYLIGDATIYVVDSSKKQNSISVGVGSDIAKYDEAKPEKVFVKIYKDEVKEIVVIK